MGAMNEWRNVAECRPTKGTIFCCGPSGGVFLGNYKGGYSVDEFDVVSCFAYDNWQGKPRRFVYWMQIPELPEEFKETTE